MFKSNILEVILVYSSFKVYAYQRGLRSYMYTYSNGILLPDLKSEIEFRVSRNTLPQSGMSHFCLLLEPVT